MSTSYWLDRTYKAKAKTFDVVIVGAGISGLSAAYWMKKEDPSLKIAVIEKGRVASGATGRNAGFITCGSVEHFNRLISKHGLEEATDIWRFSETNLKLLEEHIVQNEGESIGFEKKGCYTLAASEPELNELKSVTEIMAKLKIPVEVYDSKQILKNVGATQFVGGIRYVDDASVNPVMLVNKILQKTEGVEVFESTEAFGYTETDGGNRLLKTDNGDFECSMIVYALNGYSSSMHPYFDDKVYATRAQILMMEKVPRFMDGPCYANFFLDYFRQLPSGELLIGGFRQLAKETEVGYSDHTTPMIQNALHDFVKTHLPQFEGKQVSHRWGGVMGFSKDGQPLIGALPEDNQVFFLGGYTGHGIGLAFNSGKTLTDLIFGREIPKWISAKRFS